MMSHNIHHAEGLDNKSTSPHAKLIIDMKADLVALQEVDRGVPCGNLLNLPVELAKRTSDPKE